MWTRACIFDLDGVIVDTARYHFLAWKRLTDDLGIIFTEKDNERLKGVSRMASLDIILDIGAKKLTPSEKMELADLKNKWYVERIGRMTSEEILPGALEFINELKRNNVKIALGSASRNTPMILDRVGLNNIFDAIADGNSVHKAKPDPEVFLKAAGLIGVETGRCAVFEDALAGIEAALNAGMICIGIGDKNILKNAHMVVRGLYEMDLNKLIVLKKNWDMNSLFEYDEWCIIEEGFHPELNREAESIFSIGNGYMGQRANFEECYGGDSLQGSYVAGVYYPDKTRVGWWKNGYPEYFAKVLNAPKWIGADLSIDGKVLDLSKEKISSFRRILNMKEGYLERNFTWHHSKGKSAEIITQRFLSMAEPDLGIVIVRVKPLDFEGNADFLIYLDGDVRNEDRNYEEKFWEDIYNDSEEGKGIITSRTLKTGFYVTTGMSCAIHKNGKALKETNEIISRPGYVANRVIVNFKPGDELLLCKYVSVQSSLNYDVKNLISVVTARIDYAMKRGSDALFEDHRKAWEKIWECSDVVIEGDIAAQQAIRFNIFHLNQTYTGKDERLNIGPKGFTGEKYGGSTYWDTEAFVLPFFLKTAPMKVARNLLIYRYKHLEKSIENAQKLGFKDGAALYPMVTMNGEECHNEWEITFEEIHRNGAIAFAIYNYVRHTGDDGYLVDFGLEVLIGISRFWSQRSTYSENLGKYVILGVTGPNEYENNVNNNWYTNTIAIWTLKYTKKVLTDLKKDDPGKLEKIISLTGFRFSEETGRWEDLIENMHFPFDKERRVFLQQDGFLDKELKPAATIPENERPVNQHWSWDRILRSCFIKQADVLQGLYFLEENYDTETIKRNYDFYEPMTLHESSLSACVHSILASRTGNIKNAYSLYLRTARLDLDDYNNEVSEGLHITSMAGTWLAIVEGFGGMRIKTDTVVLNPLIPEKWKSYSFHARFREILFLVKVTDINIEISNLSDKILKLRIFEKDYEIKGSEKLTVKLTGS